MRTSEDWSMDEVGGEQLPRSTNTWRRPGTCAESGPLELVCFRAHETLQYKLKHAFSFVCTIAAFKARAVAWQV